MAFVVETGAGLSTANSYVSVADFETFATDHGYTLSGTSTQKEQALVRATAYIDGTFRSMFGGVRTHGRDQALEFPRSGLVDREGWGIDSDEMPAELKNATCEAAKRELASSGSLVPDIKAGGGVLKRVKAGSVEVEYDNDGSLTKTFQAIEQALGSLLVIRSRYSGVAVRA